MRDFSFQGRIYLGTRLANGQPDRLVWVGDQSSCDLTLNTTNSDRTEQYSGQRLQSARLRTATTVELSLALRYFTVHNAQLGFYATPHNVAAAAVVGEPLPSGLVAGDRIVLAKPAGVSALSLTDDEDAPLVLGTHYRRDAANGGVLEIIDPAALEQPFKANYSHQAFTSLPLFTENPPERYLFLDGVNTVDGARVRLHLYRVQFNPVENLGLIHEDFGDLPASGTVLFDPEMAADPELGGFGRFELPSEAA